MQSKERSKGVEFRLESTDVGHRVTTTRQPHRCHPLHVLLLLRSIYTPQHCRITRNHDFYFEWFDRTRPVRDPRHGIVYPSYRGCSPPLPLKLFDTPTSPSLEVLRVLTRTWSLIVAMLFSAIGGGCCSRNLYNSMY